MRNRREDLAQLEKELRGSAQNHRRHARITRRDDMLASISLEGTDAVEEAAVTHCEARDASPGGIGLVARREMPKGARVELWINFEGFPRKLYLVGKIGHCVAADEPGRFRVGVELVAEAKSDHDEWRDMMLAVADSPNHLMLLK